ncbi:MAG: hypothetical protein JW891_11060 [Candidatus Lokiarchaeota archaeon]|nr:hypothetical protein [Candidatus Lokiarchaeota archaeon]
MATIETRLESFQLKKPTFSNFTGDFLDLYPWFRSLEFDMVLEEGFKFLYEIPERTQNGKFNPMLRKARVEDVDDIISTYQDIYEGTYPYKEMEDPHHLQGLITSSAVEFFAFEDPITGDFCGCFTVVLDFKQKKGYTRGFVVKKKYCGRMDVLKAFLGSLVWCYAKHEGKIVRWYGESRTAHAKSQYCMRHAGFRPVAFLPNKDVFYDDVESDVLLISYDERALYHLRSEKIPQIIPEAVRCFDYSSEKYDLGRCEVWDDLLSLNFEKIKSLTRKAQVKKSTGEFGYETYSILIKGTDSCLSFVHAPRVNNMENAKYRAFNNEELFVLARAFSKQVSKLKCRYAEIYLSAHEPVHQRIFYDVGFYPRGHVPSWKYDNKTGRFEDYLLFNQFKKSVEQNMELLKEGRALARVFRLD